MKLLEWEVAVMRRTKEVTVKILVSDILLDESIYPRDNLDHRRIAIFVDNIRDGFEFDPIKIQPYPGKKGKYRILDGVHRNAHKKAGCSPKNCMRPFGGNAHIGISAK